MTEKSWLLQIFAECTQWLCTDTKCCQQLYRKQRIHPTWIICGYTLVTLLKVHICASLRLHWPVTSNLSALPLTIRPKQQLKNIQWRCPSARSPSHILSTMLAGKANALHLFRKVLTASLKFISLRHPCIYLWSHTLIAHFTTHISFADMTMQGPTQPLPGKPLFHHDFANFNVTHPSTVTHMSPLTHTSVSIPRSEAELLSEDVQKFR
jgi:hypothetical protein